LIGFSVVLERKLLNQTVGGNFCDLPPDDDGLVGCDTIWNLFNPAILWFGRI
jgi:hypothetical protein